MRPLSVLVFSLFTFASQGFFDLAHSQFSYHEIKDDSGFEFEKPVQVYWYPRYNRVEGLFVNLGVKVRPEFLTGVQAYSDAGWGFSNEDDKEFRYHVGVRKDLFEFNRLSFGFEAFKELASEDDWLIGETENSIYSVLFREDYKDYYGIDGFRFYVDHKFKGVHTLRLEVERRTYDALQRNVNWSVFKGDFSENPNHSDSFIAEGDELGLRLIAAFDWRDNPIFPLTGWYLAGIYEHTADDFDTDGLFLTVKRYFQTFGNNRLLLKGMLGTRHGSIADQHTIDLGGIGSLRAYDDKEFTGNRMVMFNANYLFGGDILQKIPLQDIPFIGAFWTTLSLGVFLDTGWADFTDVDDGIFSGFGDIDLQTNVGFSVLVLDGVLRMDVARRTNSDPGKDDYRITFRLLESF